MKALLHAVLLIATAVAGQVHGETPKGTWHGERTGVKFHPSGENLAFDKPASTVHPKLTEHSRKMVANSLFGRKPPRFPYLGGSE